MFTGMVTLGIAMFGLVVWSVRQEGRINAHDQLFSERDEQAKERYNETTRRLERIENKLDQLNGRGRV